MSLIPGQLGSDASRLIERAKPAVGAASSASSKLPEAVRSFIELIFSEKMMKAHLVEQNLDLDRVRRMQLDSP